MKILIIGAHPGGNKGAEAMLEVLVEQLSKNNTTIEFIFESLSEKENYSNFDKKNISYLVSKFSVKNLFLPYDKNLNKVKYVIDIGGLNYTDKSIRNNLRSFIKHFGLIIRGKKLIFFTQDFGPANKITTKVMAGLIMMFAYKVFARSSISKKVLLKQFFIAEKKVEGPFPDSTLIYKDKTVKNIVESSDYIVITPSAIMYNQYGDKYLKYLKEIIDYFLNKNKVFILVHCFTKNGNSSDMEVAIKLQEGNIDVQLIAENISPLYIKNFLANSKLVITSRYHVLVGAMSCGVPSIAIGWNEKYTSFLDLYAMSYMSLEFNDDIVNQIVQLVENHINKEMRDKLYKINKKLEENVYQSFKILNKVLG